jgi:streptogramin lyase
VEQLTTVVGEPVAYEEDELPSSIVAGSDALWGVVRERNEVLRIDPETGRVSDRFTLGSPYSAQAAELSSVRFGAGAVWVGTRIGNRAGVIDPA